jgi:hypothetical protein
MPQLFHSNTQVTANRITERERKPHFSRSPIVFKLRVLGENLMVFILSIDCYSGRGAQLSTHQHAVSELQLGQDS